MALDAKFGQILRHYDVQHPGDLRLCCGPANRSVGIGGDLVFMATLDGNLIAFDHTAGKVAWNEVVTNFKMDIRLLRSRL